MGGTVPYVPCQNLVNAKSEKVLFHLNRPINRKLSECKLKIFAKIAINTECWNFFRFIVCNILIFK